MRKSARRGRVVSVASGVQTTTGRKQLRTEAAVWERYAASVSRLLAATAEPAPR